MMIVLSGTIGAGKSSLATILAKHLGTEPFYEQVDDNPVLPLFYKDPKQYAFLLQIYFLNKRFDAIKRALSNNNNVLDRSIYEDSLFFHMNADMGRATQEEVEVYDELLANMMQELPYAADKKAPDLLIQIDVTLPKMLERIKKRGREYEQVENDPSLMDYYKNLLSRYDDWYDNYDYSPKMRINGDELDFIENEDDCKTVLKMIDAEIKKRNMI